MYCHIIVGAKGSGKTTFIKENIISKVRTQNLLVYDPQREYKEITGDKPLLKIEDFCKRVERSKNMVCIFEESTIFFDTRSNNAMMKQILVSTRHTQNIIVMVFHSIRSIPVNIYELSDYFTVFKTQDSIDISARQMKDERLKDVLTEVKEEYDKGNVYYNKTIRTR